MAVVEIACRRSSYGASLVGFSADGEMVYLHGSTRPPGPRAGLLQVFSGEAMRPYHRVSDEPRHVAYVPAVTP